MLGYEPGFDIWIMADCEIYLDIQLSFVCVADIQTEFEPGYGSQRKVTYQRH